jgi:toxin ParE1/3/4
VKLELIYQPSARADLDSLYDWIADRADPHTAFGYVGRIQAACRALLDFPGRGTPRGELGPGLRSVSFERRATIHYRVTDDAVEIVRVLHKGRLAEDAFGAG